jgi:hypothetical protein
MQRDVRFDLSLLFSVELLYEKIQFSMYEERRSVSRQMVLADKFMRVDITNLKNEF